MDKFGLIDIFTKLAQNKNIENMLSSTLNSLFTKPPLQQKDSPPATPNTSKLNKNKYSQEAILNLLKRHDEISKTIDKNLEKPPKK